MLNPLVAPDEESSKNLKKQIMNREPDRSASIEKGQLSQEDIASVFSQLGLESEEERSKFRMMAQVNASGVDRSILWLTGTTAIEKEVQGGENA